jgi:hypothetical protein
MSNRIASILETTTVIATLVAAAVFTYDTLGTSYFSVPSEVTHVAAVSSFSSAPARVAEPKAVRMDVVCGEICGADERSTSRAIPEEKAPGF